MSETMVQPRGRTFGKLIADLFKLAIGSYGLIVSGFIILRWLVGETWLPVVLYDTVAHLLWIAALLLFPLCLLLRFWRVALLLLLPAGAFIFTYGAQFLGSAGDYIGANGFSIMTYNIQWRTGNYTDTIRLIRAADADIVAIQELGEQAAALLEDGLADDYRYMALHPHRTGTVGQGILSRYPILDSAFWQSDFLPSSFGHQRAVIEVDGTEIVVYNVHLNHPFVGSGFFNAQQRTLQVEDILDRIREEGLAARVVLLGDFNMTDLNEDYTRIDERLTDAYFDAGRGLGWTFSFGGRRYGLPPLARLDYIFIGYGLDTVDARVLNSSAGSDHRPVWAQLSIYDPTAS